MATVAHNPLIESLSGMVGQTLVFRKVGQKTIVANRPSLPKKQSELQRYNRSKFRLASMYAHEVLLDPVMKEYYKKKAKKLNLPNAYTAAITDYMRKTKAKASARYDGGTVYEIVKKDFELKEITATIEGNDQSITVRSVVKNQYNEWVIAVGKEERITRMNITDNTGSYDWPLNQLLTR